MQMEHYAFSLSGGIWHSRESWKGSIQSAIPSCSRFPLMHRGAVLGVPTMHIARWSHQNLISLSGGAFLPALLAMSNLAQSDLLFEQKWAHFLNRCQATQRADVCPTWETSFLFSRGRGDIEIYDVFDAAAMFAPLLFRAHKFITGKRNVGIKRAICVTAAAAVQAACKMQIAGRGRTLLCATFPKWPVKVVLWCFQPSEPQSRWLIIAGDRISQTNQPSVCILSPRGYSAAAHPHLWIFPTAPAIFAQSVDFIIFRCQWSDLPLTAHIRSYAIYMHWYPSSIFHFYNFNLG